MTGVKYKIGDLVKLRIELRFSKEQVINIGDYGIIVANDLWEGNPVPFDYLIIVNGIEILVFKGEVDLVT